MLIDLPPANRFRIVLKNADGNAVLISPVAPLAGERYVSVPIASANLPAGDYSLSLQTGKTPDEYQDWESYFFGVVRN